MHRGGDAGAGGKEGTSEHGAAGLQGPEAPGCHEAAAVSREHIIKGLTCQA